MKVKHLLIERKDKYDNDYPNQLVGLVQMQGEHGKQEVKLSNAVVAQIFSLIKSDCQRVANYNAEQTSHAIEEAENEPKLLEADAPF